MLIQSISFAEAIRTLAPTLVVVAVFFLLVLGGFLWMVYHYLDFEKKSRLIDLRLKNQDRIIPLQLNAYERITVFLERMNPSSLMIRNYEPGMKSRDLQIKAVGEIRNEYEHNLSQQIYVSQESWEVLKKVKDETIMLINGQLSVSGGDISGLEFSKLVLEKMSKMEVNPYDFAIDAVKREVKELF